MRLIVGAVLGVVLFIVYLLWHTNSIKVELNTTKDQLHSTTVRVVEVEQALVQQQRLTEWVIQMKEEHEHLNKERHYYTTKLEVLGNEIGVSNSLHPDVTGLLKSFKEGQETEHSGD